MKALIAVLAFGVLLDGVAVWLALAGQSYWAITTAVGGLFAGMAGLVLNTVKASQP